MMNRTSGFTVIELILSAVILVVILAIVGDFLISSLRLTEQTEAQNEMQVNLRSAMEMVTQDLFSSGSDGIAPNDCGTDFSNPATPALSADATTDFGHTFTVTYCDPYEATTSVVSYRIAQDTANNNVMTLFRDLNGNEFAAAPGIRAFELAFQCKTGPCTAATLVPDDVLSITVKMTGQSSWKAKRVNQTCEFDTVSNPRTCTSEAGYYYEYAEQKISPPNLRY